MTLLAAHANRWRLEYKIYNNRLIQARRNKLQPHEMNKDIEIYNIQITGEMSAEARFLSLGSPEKRVTMLLTVLCSGLVLGSSLHCIQHSNPA